MISFDIFSLELACEEASRCPNSRKCENLLIGWGFDDSDWFNCSGDALCVSLDLMSSNNYSFSIELRPEPFLFPISRNIIGDLSCRSDSPYFIIIFPRFLYITNPEKKLVIALLIISFFIGFLNLLMNPSGGFKIWIPFLFLTETQKWETLWHFIS